MPTQQSARNITNSIIRVCSFIRTIEKPSPIRLVAPWLHHFCQLLGMAETETLSDKRSEVSRIQQLSFYS
jgi:hypothetical protein